MPTVSPTLQVVGVALGSGGLRITSRTDVVLRWSFRALRGAPAVAASRPASARLVATGRRPMICPMSVRTDRGVTL